MIPLAITKSDRIVSRRELLASTAAAVGAAAIARAPLLAAGEPNGRVRNVILIITDTLRRDVLKCYGSDWVKTPNLDKFAGKALVMDNAYLSSFPTVPCRNDVLSGRCSFTYKRWSPIDPDAVTLQDIIYKTGMRTALFVDTPHPFTDKYGYHRGFDIAYRVRGQESEPWKREPKNPKLPCDVNKLRSQDRVTKQYLRNVHDRKSEEDYFVAQTMRSSAHWLGEHHDEEPFFMYVDTFDPHEPWDPPQHYVDMYDPGYTGQEVIYPRYELWREFLTEAELKHCRALYAGEASMVDRWIGHLLETIESCGLLNNTMIIITTDHGFYLGEHGFIGKAWIRGNRYQNIPLYPEVSRIPMIVYYPGCRAGGRISAFAQHIDLMPTILDFLGIAIPSFAVGYSLSSVLDGLPDRRARKLAISSPTIAYAGLKSPIPTDRSTITDGQWLLIYGAPYESFAGTAGGKSNAIDSKERKTALLGEPPKPELYDLKTDPGCTTNVYAKNLEAARELHDGYVAFLERCQMRPDLLKHYRVLPEPKASG